MKDVKKYLKSFYDGSNLSDYSVNHYVLGVTRIVSYILDRKDMANIEDFDDEGLKKILIKVNKKPQEFIRYVLDKRPESKLNEQEHSYVLSYLDPWMSFVKHAKFFYKSDKDPIKLEWERLKNFYQEKLNEDRNKRTVPKNYTETVKEITMDRIIEIRDGLKNGSFEKLLITLYTELPPSRGGDYASVKLYRSDLSEDIIDRHENCMVISKDFTRGVVRFVDTKVIGKARDFDQVVIELPKIVLNQVYHYIDRNNTGKYLFVKPDGQQYTQKAFSNKSNRAFASVFGSKFNVNTNYFRHMYILVHKDTPLDKRVQLSKLMGHNVITSLSYQWKTDKPLVSNKLRQEIISRDYNTDFNIVWKNTIRDIIKINKKYIKDTSVIRVDV